MNLMMIKPFLISYFFFIIWACFFLSKCVASTNMNGNCFSHGQKASYSNNMQNILKLYMFAAFTLLQLTVRIFSKSNGVLDKPTHGLKPVSLAGACLRANKASGTCPTQLSPSK